MSEFDDAIQKMGTGSDESEAFTPVASMRLSDFKRDTNLENILVEGRWGVRGTFGLFVSTTGGGKSIIQTQMALCFSRGIPFCGLKPTRRLRVWVVQSEDDEDRVAWDRDDVTAHLTEKYPDEDWAAAAHEVVFKDFTGITGAAFIEQLDMELTAMEGTPEMPDMIMLNPWNKFYGLDPMSHKDCSAFLAGGELGRSAETKGLEEMIKRHRVWLLIFAHTPKPPTPKEIKSWVKDSYSFYKVCGTSALPDAARSVMTFLRVPDHEGLFYFSAGKNGNGLGWRNADGSRCTRAYFKWGDDGRHYWQDVDKILWAEYDAELEERKPTRGTSGSATNNTPPRDEMPILVEAFKRLKNPVTKGDAVVAVRHAIDKDRIKTVPTMKGISRNDATDLLNLAINNGTVCAVELGGNKGTFCGLPPVMDKWRKQKLPDTEEGEG